MKQWKLVAVAALCLVAAGCRSEGDTSLSGATQATFGAVNPAVPQGWTKQIRPNGVIVFTCPDNSCPERGEIAYSEMNGSGDIEAAMRSGMTSPNYLKNMGDALSRASGGMLKQVAFKDMSDADAIRFERVLLKKTAVGSEYSIMHRTVQGSRSRIVSADAPTLAKARRYMKIGLTGLQ